MQVLVLLLVSAILLIHMQSFRAFSLPQGFKRLSRPLRQYHASSSVLKATAPSKLSDALRKSELSRLQAQGWQIVNNRDAIFKKFLFTDFKQAFTFMTNVAFHSESMAHHPEWFNVYNRVEVTLSTHDCAGLSMLDVTMADYMDGQFQKLQ